MDETSITMVSIDYNVLSQLVSSCIYDRKL